MSEVSPTRLYLGNLPRAATKSDIAAHFGKHGTGEITEIKLMNGFGFIEYKDAMDARDVVPAFHGSDFMGERLTVQFARGSRHRPGEGSTATNGERTAPRPRRTLHRMQISGLPSETSWQDLKDFARQSGCDVVYSETRNGSGEGFVEFESAADLTTAVEKLDGREFKGRNVTCVADPNPPKDTRPNRSRSPQGRRGGAYPPSGEDWDRRGGPPRASGGGGGGGAGAGAGAGYSPRRDGYRDGYRDRSPRRDYYEDRARYRSPPRRGPPEDYPPPRGRYEDPYRRDYPPDPYAAGRAYDRPPVRDFPPREGAYPREGYPREGYPREAYPRDYDRGRY